MGDKPILFSAPMVRAILSGTKTMTRRALKPQPTLVSDNNLHWIGEDGKCHEVRWTKGDRLWVREAFSYDRNSIIRIGDHHGYLEESPIWYWADGNPEDGDWTKPKPSIHMPRWASRITLSVTDVLVERLQDITEADAIAEGVGWHDTGSSGDNDLTVGDPIPAYSRLWDHINGPGAWEANPWVAAISFRREIANVE
jgi:hypothetical protein